MPQDMGKHDLFSVPTLLVAATIGIVFLSGPGAAADVFSPATAPHARVEIELTTLERERVVELTNTCIRATNTFLGRRKSPPSILISDEPSQRDNVVVVQSPLEKEAAAKRIVERLVKRRIEPLLDRPWENVSSDLHWLVAAIMTEVLYMPSSEQGVDLPPCYEGIRKQFHSGHFPELTRLLTVEVPHNYPLFQRLHRTHSHLFTLMVLNTQPNRARHEYLHNIIKRIGQGGSPVEAVGNVLREGDTLQKNTQLQEWYEKNASQASLRGNTFLGDKETHRRLQELQRIRVPQDMSTGSVKSSVVPLEKFSEMIQQEEGASLMLQKLTQKFHKLTAWANPLFRPALLKYADALQALHAGEERKFQRKLKKAHAMYRDLHEKKQDINAFLTRTAGDHLPPEKRYPFLYQAIDVTFPE